MSCRVDVIYQFCYILLVLESFLKRFHVIRKLLIRLFHRQKFYGFSVHLQVLEHEHRMISFFLRLNHVPVAETAQALVLIIVCKSQIQICGKQFLVYLGIE